MVEQTVYLSYLLQSYNVPDLKKVCKSFGIKGYSSLKKQELINFIVDSLSEDFFSLKDWNLTKFPANLGKILEMKI